MSLLYHSWEDSKMSVITAIGFEPRHDWTNLSKKTTLQLSPTVRHRWSDVKTYGLRMSVSNFSILEIEKWKGPALSAIQTNSVASVPRYQRARVACRPTQWPIISRSHKRMNCRTQAICTDSVVFSGVRVRHPRRCPLVWRYFPWMSASKIWIQNSEYKVVGRNKESIYATTCTISCDMYLLRTVYHTYFSRYGMHCTPTVGRTYHMTSNCM